MSSKDTQEKILHAAVLLFNEHGTAGVTASQIAYSCGISKGHMHYHYKNKEELILAIVWKIVKEIEASWYKDDNDYSPGHLADSFLRHIALNYKYRFFYRELPSLLRSSELIKRRFIECRQRRVKAFGEYIEKSAEAGIYRSTQQNQYLIDNVTATWVFADNWLNYLEASGITIDRKAVSDGYRIMKAMLKPGLTDKAYESLPVPEVLNVSFLDN